jgi:hypothetical protein
MRPAASSLRADNVRLGIRAALPVTHPTGAAR